jgi:nucleoside-diphosphate-sugar epimerase
LSSVLIIGGLGFIGTYLTEKLESLNYDVHVFDRLRVSRNNYYRGDINDYQSLERTFDIVKPDIVVHLAAMVSRKECEETPKMAITTNVEGTHNVCVLSLKHEARLIYAGSSEEYGSAFQKTTVNENTPFGKPTSIYSMTKRMAEELIQYNAYFKGLVATTLRVFMLYGPREEPTDYRSALARFSYLALKGETLTVHKNTERSWCYIEDAIEAIKITLDRNQEEKYEVFNIGRREPILTQHLAEKIVRMCHSTSKIDLVEVVPTIIPIKRASFKKAKEVLGWEATTPLSDGLQRQVNYVTSLLK